jgi:hypothetical protein
MSAKNVTHLATSLLVMQSKIKAALYGMYIGDALAMPVHWYYDTRRIKKDFGEYGIQKYEAPVHPFPGSIMNLSNTGGGGRGSDKNSIVGEVILHGKKQFWIRGGSYHYHHGMSAGENTLDTLIARVMLKVLLSMDETKQPGIDRDVTAQYRNTNEDKTSKQTNVDKNWFTEAFLNTYIQFMTTPGTHNDVYAATAHRTFFANHANNKDKYVCADNDGHNTDSVDGIINVLVLSLNEMVVNARKMYNVDESMTIDVKFGVNTNERKNESFKKAIFDSINMIRKSEQLPLYGYIYHNLLVKIIWEQKDLRKAILEIIDEHPTVFKRGANSLSKKHLEDFRLTDASSDPMSACYVSSNFPVMLMFAYKYAGSLEKALLASANAGGENVNRNALLGGIMGASTGMNEETKRLLDGLAMKDEIVKEVEEFSKIDNTKKSEL